jgi:predicted alpha/beta-fold hydrolase
MGHFARSPLDWKHSTEDVVVDAPDDVRILLRATWQGESRSKRPALLLIHGLEGCDRSGYMLSAGMMAYESGWHVVRMNMRGCGDSLDICPRIYNAGVCTDLIAVLDWLASMVNTIVVVGFSLGANLALLTLARHRSAIPREVVAGAAVSPPLDLAVASDAMSLRRNRIYQTYYLSRIKRGYRRRQRLLPELYAPGRERRSRTLREYDDAIVAPYSGYRNADDYYAKASSGPHLTTLDRDVLILASSDDPFIPRESIVGWPVASSVRVEITDTGGHVGYVGHTVAPGTFWAAERLVHFLQTFT